MTVVTLYRFAYTPIGVFGEMRVNGKAFYTVERPWKDNKQNVSCIPAGKYRLYKRASGVVQRSSRGAYKEGWEVCDVKNRSFIMLHPGNTMDDLEGCIAVGTELGFVSGKWAVTNSQEAFKELMTELDESPSWEIHICRVVPVAA